MRLQVFVLYPLPLFDLVKSTDLSALSVPKNKMIISCTEKLCYVPRGDTSGHTKSNKTVEGMYETKSPFGFVLI